MRSPTVTPEAILDCVVDTLEHIPAAPSEAAAAKQTMVDRARRLAGVWDAVCYQPKRASIKEGDYVVALSKPYRRMLDAIEYLGVHLCGGDVSEVNSHIRFQEVRDDLETTIRDRLVAFAIEYELGIPEETAPARKVDQ